MVFKFSFFRSQGGLLGKKRDVLESVAAEASKSRLDYEKQKKEEQETSQHQRELAYFEHKIQVNQDEIQRRRVAILHLTEQEKEIQQKMDNTFAIEKKDPREIENALVKNRELQKKLDHILMLQRFHNAEIERLTSQNEASEKKIRRK
ncbi:MAG: hypothetical protein FGM57_00200 [Candidatus Taylorbacteria bacterium]|nr:hypothetical protein [Candidatus Taylorbacteria bacterium]